MWEKRGDEYRGATYAQIRHAVVRFAAGLMSLGVQKGDRVALIAEGRNDWVISELGILFAGGINVPLSVKLQEGPDLKFRLAHSGCKTAVASAGQVGKLRKLKKELPDLTTIILLDAMEQTEPDEIVLDRLYEIGEKYLVTNEEDVEARRLGVREDDPANICYTSGTTADPKGVVLTHRNYTANIEQASALLPVPEWYSSLLILPWDHCFAHTAGIYTLMKNGASMAAVQVGKTPIETLKNIPGNIKESRPTFLLSVPTLAKNFRKNIEAGVAAKGAVAERLFRWGLAVAERYNGNGWNRGKGFRILLQPLKSMFDAILFKKIRDQFGGRLEFFVGGGALLDIELQRFFYAIGIPMLQGYGLTESSPIISANVPRKHKLGSSGSLVEHLEVRICDEQGVPLPVGQHGEIVVKGENVMAGYWQNENATREMIRDGWLYTGDLGYLDNDGFLYVLGRTKSLLIANDGEKYSPEGIEEMMCSQSAFIDQMMLYNNQSPYTVALLVPNKEAILRWAKTHGVSLQSPDGQRTVLDLLGKEVEKYKNGGVHGGIFPERWLPSAIGVLEEGFTEANGLLNSTLKMVRGRITTTYKTRIESLSTIDGKNIASMENVRVVAGWSQGSESV
jgi:long-chain acyl-CoA synthetase